MFAGRRIGLDGGQITAVTPDAALRYLRRKTSKDVHPLRGLGADHVFNCRRAEALLKQVMLSAADTMPAPIYLSWYRWHLVIERNKHHEKHH